MTDTIYATPSPTVEPDDLEPLRIKPSQRNITYQTVNPDIWTLYENYKSRDLILDPDFQRHFVWDRQKASNLIESIILRIPIPVIFTAEDTNDSTKEEVIDGQQRLQSIFSFIDGHFPDSSDFRLSKLKILTELAGKHFNELDSETQKKIKKHALTIVRIHAGSQEDIKFEMFERLNTNITRLNAQELRNCLYRGNYNDLIKRLALEPEFLRIMNMTPAKNRRMVLEEYILIFFAFTHQDYHQYTSPLKQFLNEDMRQYRVLSDGDRVDLEAKFKQAVTLTNHVFDKDAFHIFTIDKNTNAGTFARTKINQGLYFIIMYWFAIYPKTQVILNADLIREELLNLEIHNDEFIDCLTGSGTNSKEKIIRKFDIWGNTLKNILDYPKDEPRAFTYELKEQLWQQSQTCNLCSQHINHIDNAEVDHIICWWKGGRTIPENARLVHRLCNRMRGGDYANSNP